MNLFNQQYFLYKYQIEAIKREVTEHLEVDIAKKVLEAIIKCFLKWQVAHGVKPVIPFGGLLSSIYDANKEPEKLTDDEIDKFAPWECAGYGVNNYIDLAFKLWLDDFKPFNEVKNEYGLHLILTVLLNLISSEDVHHSNSIFRAYDYILHYRQWILEAKYEILKNDIRNKEKKHNQQIKEARQIAAYNKKAKSNEFKRLWNEWAIETKKANPFWSKKQIVAHVCEVAKHRGHKMVNGKPYSITTIDKFISVKEAQVS